MCRWLAYSGPPIALSRLVLDPEHSLIDQSLSARSAKTTTSGDGFGVGWYDERGNPGLYKDVRPAWNDRNLHDLCAHVRSSMFLAHVRSATGPVTIQRSNCHPFRYGRWLFMHNGEIREFEKVRRELMFAVAPERFADVEGTTDSELMFHLALSLGMEEDVRDGIARMVGLVEDVGRRAGIEHPIVMTLGVADGERLHSFRYASDGRSVSLFRSRGSDALRALAPPGSRAPLAGFSDDARAIVSEPLTDLAASWEEIPESSHVSIADGEVTCVPFAPER